APAPGAGSAGAAPRAPMPPRPAAPAPRPAAPSRPATPGPFSGLAADFRSEPRVDAPARPRTERSSLEDTARDLNRSLRPERPAAPAPRAPEPRAPEPRAPEARSAPASEQPPFLPPRPRPTESATRAPAPSPRPTEPAARAPAPSPRPIDRGAISDGAADAISRALSEPFDLGDDLGHPAPRADTYRTEPPPADRPLPSWMARSAAEQASSARAPSAAPDFGAGDEAYDYGRSALEGDGYEAQEGVDQTYEVEADEEPRRRGRSRLVMIGGLVVVAVAATAGVYAYMSGPSVTTVNGEPPVIHADQGPNKVVPDKPPQDQASEGQKLIYDRVGGAPTTGNEKVVSSEEQPVDMSQAAQPQPRVIQTTPGNGQASSGQQAAAPAPSDMTEPKRVRTLTVRADGTIVDDASPSPSPMPSDSPSAVESSVQPTASTPIALSPGSGAPVSTDPTPMSNTPSIVPNVPLPPTRVAAVPSTDNTPPAPAATSEPAPAGTYVVQVASVRSEAEAQATWKSMQAKYPGILGSQQVAIRRADLGDRGIYYRTQVGSFASRDEANNLCQALRSQGGDCMVQRN
ncbi:SPOR domain-containing protein, partial [Ancylobacter mangrovi]|uniref:SPOR domain-containing protein n=1 Tax=Ancylobacter mangrovi TaxID=2972472 RepID=UPI002162FE4C